MLREQPAVVDHDVFVVHADDDTPFVNGELLPMLGLPSERVILSNELPFPAFTEQAIEGAVQRSRLTLEVVSPAYLRDRWAGFAELLSRNVRKDGRGGSLVPLRVARCRRSWRSTRRWIAGRSSSGKRRRRGCAPGSGGNTTTPVSMM